MASKEEIIQELKNEIRRLVADETQSLKNRLTAVRDEMMNSLGGFEEEILQALPPITDRLETHFQETVGLLLQTQAAAQEQLETMTQQLAVLTAEGEHRESEEHQLHEKNEQLNEQVFRLEEELARVNNEQARLAQGQAEMDLLRTTNEQLNEQISSLGQDVAKREEEVVHLRAECASLDQRSAAMVEEYAQAKGEAARATRTLLERLTASLDHFEAKKSQVDILTSFLDEASHYSARAALFVAKGDVLWGWRAHGFSSPAFSDSEIKSVHFPLSSDTVFREAFVEKRSIRAQRGSHPNNQLVLDRLGTPLRDSFVAIPLIVKDKSSAVLYADGGLQADGFFDPEGLELLVRLVALLVEVLAYRARTPGASKPHVQVAAAEVAHSGLDKSVPMEHAPSSETAATIVTPPSLTFAAKDEPTASIEGVSRGMPEAAPVPAANEYELKLHNDAKRFARLLVSEIKLYNEQKVLTGRRNRDLYDRLKEEIDRSRQMYAKRVSPIVASKVDYFYDELVRTLGENDLNTLGSDCPGPIISGTE